MVGRSILKSKNLLKLIFLFILVHIKFEDISTIYAISWKKVLDPDGPYIGESTKNKKCQSVGNFGILSVVCLVCSTATIYTISLRRLKYLQKYKNTVWKKDHKNEQHLFLLTYIFTKVSQNVCLIHTLILIYW